MFKFQFNSVADFFAMGIYGFYVWVAYGAFFAVILWNWWQPRMERRRIVRLLRARGERQQEQQGGNATSATQQQSAQQ
ncbi:MAG TPA: heme exporter protein CcmD [Candidatus Acidoferrum sp.]|nr:heme exporter protein CcmD [Candidatus Acidoferrum sp.]